MEVRGVLRAAHQLFHGLVGGARGGFVILGAENGQAGDEERG